MFQLVFLLQARASSTSSGIESARLQLERTHRNIWTKQGCLFRGMQSRYHVSCQCSWPSSNTVNNESTVHTRRRKRAVEMHYTAAAGGASRLQGLQPRRTICVKNFAGRAWRAKKPAGNTVENRYAVAHFEYHPAQESAADGRWSGT